MSKALIYPAPDGLPVPIRPTAADKETYKRLEETDWSQVLGLRNDDLVRAGGLWLYGFLDAAHQIAQQNPSVEGSYWHALVHRSEGDFSNSMYWFGRVGKHAIFPSLYSQVKDLCEEESRSFRECKPLLEGGHWVPRRFVDLCEEASRGRLQAHGWLQKMAAAEYNLLMEHVIAQSSG